MKYQQLPRHQLELLIAHLFQKDRLWVLTHGDSQLSDTQQKSLTQYVAKLTSDTPLAYIVGYKRFYDVDFIVNTHVLIPRQETEELIQHIIEQRSEVREQRAEIRDQRAEETKGKIVADIGTGSGCIGLTLARLLPQYQFLLVDKSEKALAVARQNYQKQSSPSNVKFFQGDLIMPLIKEELFPEVIIANLPYISQKLYQELPTSVAQYEPRLALDGGFDGLVLYRQLIKQIELHYQGKHYPDLWFEISPEQAVLIPDLFKDSLRVNIRYIKDLNDRIRFVHISTN